jgi:capsular polysaccharide biosynthesis protein
MSADSMSGFLSGREVSLKEAAQGAGVRYAAAPLERPPYHWIRQADHPLQTHLELAWLQDVCIVDVFNIFLPTQEQFVTEVTYPRSLNTWRVPHERERGMLSLLTKKPVIAIKEPVLLIGGQNNHYHWLLNWLPRLLVWDRLREEMPPIPNNLKVAVHHGITESHLESLAMCGIKKDDIILLRPDVYRYSIRDAIIPNFFSSHCYYREVNDFLYKLSLGIPAADNWGIYVSRNNIAAPRRRIRNENLIENAMSNFGVRKVALEAMTMREQIAAFRGASAIISSHGAGLANLAFSRRGSDLLLFENNRISEFVELAMICDVHCHVHAPPQHIDADYEAANPSFHARNRDFLVDPALVRGFLSEVARRHPPRTG